MRSNEGANNFILVQDWGGDRIRQSRKSCWHSSSLALSTCFFSSLIVAISNSWGLTFNILRCRGLENRWHRFISVSLRWRVPKFHPGLPQEDKTQNDKNDCVWCKPLFIFLRHNWIKLIAWTLALSADDGPHLLLITGRKTSICTVLKV